MFIIVSLHFVMIQSVNFWIHPHTCTLSDVRVYSIYMDSVHFRDFLFCGTYRDRTLNLLMLCLIPRTLYEYKNGMQKIEHVISIITTSHIKAEDKHRTELSMPML
jgi:hypothetical protein